MDEQIARIIFVDLARGLDYIHETANLVHHAIRLESLLYASKHNSTVKQDRAQIGNLKYVTEPTGAKRRHETTLKLNHDYCRQYLAPEMFK